MSCAWNPNETAFMATCFPNAERSALKAMLKPVALRRAIAQAHAKAAARHAG